MTRRVDLVAILALLALGCVHNFVAAPATFEALDARSLWFVTGGIVLWYAAIINYLGMEGSEERFARVSLIFSNLVLVGFAILFMWVRSSWTNPQNLALMVPALWLLARSTRLR